MKSEAIAQDPMLLETGDSGNGAIVARGQADCAW